MCIGVYVARTNELAKAAVLGEEGKCGPSRLKVHALQLLMHSWGDAMLAHLILIACAVC